MRKRIRISILEIHDGHLFIAGNLQNYNPDKEQISVKDETGELKIINPARAKAVDTEATERKKATRGYYYEIMLPMHVGARYTFICRHGNASAILSPLFGKYSRLTDIDGCSFSSGKFLIHCENDTIVISRNTLITRTPIKRRFGRALANEASSDITRIRKSAEKFRASGKPIWLVSDRSDCASDNGRAFFEYLMTSDDAAAARSSYDIRFVIGADSSDYEIMNQTGPVVEAGSELHKILHIASDMVISSSADEWIRNPLGTDLKFYRDMIDNDFVFLQHGVIKDDLSAWLHRLNKNLHLFITSAYDEWESICTGDYSYDESIVKLTGLARFDKLDSKPAKKIAIIPTWRNYAAPDIIPGTSSRPYSDSYKETEYFSFYNRLINDPAILKAMNDAGYTGTFYLHPNHMEQWKDYDSNDTISVWSEHVPFSRVFSESSLLITDYSSVAIDFAYLGKPVIYTQFDRNNFAVSHSYVPGYYDYERDGFGPVCYDYEDSVAAIVKAIENGCIEEALYLERVNKFFAFRDKNNCKRIYDEIMKLQI